MADKKTEGHVEHPQDFAVVLLKKGVDIGTATPEDYRRVHVRASSIGAAEGSEEVAAACAEGDGYVVQTTTNPGLQTEGERMASARGHHNGSRWGMNDHDPRGR